MHLPSLLSSFVGPVSSSPSKQSPTFYKGYAVKLTFFIILAGLLAIFWVQFTKGKSPEKAGMGMQRAYKGLAQEDDEGLEAEETNTKL